MSRQERGTAGDIQRWARALLLYREIERQVGLAGNGTVEIETSEGGVDVTFERYPRGDCRRAARRGTATQRCRRSESYVAAIGFVALERARYQVIERSSEGFCRLRISDASDIGAQSIGSCSGS